MRDYILLYINGKKHIINAHQAKKNLSTYIRENLDMKGTKIVCSEGDCGACTVLVNNYFSIDKMFISINSCIAPLYLLDCCHIITVEGIEESESYHAIQSALAQHHGTQCGFCTPGFVNSFAFMCDQLSIQNRTIDTKKIQNYTTGNLCRCTGYKGIIEAGLSLNLEKITPLYERYFSQKIVDDFKKAALEEVSLKHQDEELQIVKDLKSAVELKKEGYSVISGGTDISVFVNKGFNKNKKFVSLSHIQEFYEIKEDSSYVYISPNVTLTKVEEIMKNSFPSFSNALKIFASPQIKNKGTLIGNVANGSPIGDTIPFLYVSDSLLELSSTNSKREILLRDFYLGYKQFDLKDDEIITKVKIPKSFKNYKFYKVSARKDLDISAVSLAISYKIKENKIKHISLAYGGVDATVYKAVDLENFLLEKKFTKENFVNAIKIIPTLLSPFSDHRGSSEYRVKLCQNLLLKFFHEVSFERKDK
jgi:xanthine dehydrogenase small subunit